MTTELLILVREPERARDMIESVADSIRSKLATQGELARLVSIERLRKLGNGQEVSALTMLRVALAGSAVFDFATVMSRIENELARLARDAEVALKFEILRVVTTENGAAS